VIVLAHGIGGREDLPLPGDLVLQAGGAVVLVTFLAVALLWREPRFAGAVRGRPLPATLRRVLDAPALRAVLRWLGALVGAYLLVVAFIGPADADANPVPRALYVLVWVGLVPTSLLLGPVWRLVNPLRTVHRLLAAALRVPAGGVRELPARLGYWPAAASLAVFVWLELVAPHRDEPQVVGAFLVLYGAAHVAAALVFGASWFERGDGFEVYSALIGSLAPIGRRPDGTLVLRNPLVGLAQVVPAPGLVAVLAVWWGSTVFDGLTGATAWINWSEQSRVAIGTLTLAVLIALVAGSYRLATGKLAAELASTLVPIAVGYTLAHYAALLLVEAPRGLAQLGVPLGLGEQLGPVTADAVPAPTVLAVIQVAAILAGHVVAVLAAHDRSAALLPAHRRLADQIPLVLLMVVYTMVGLFLLVVA